MIFFSLISDVLTQNSHFHNDVNEKNKIETNRINEIMETAKALAVS